MFIPVHNGPFNHSDQLLEDPQPVPSWREGDDGVFGKELLEQEVLDLCFAEDLPVWELYVIVILQKLSTEASDLVELRGGGRGAHGGVGERDSQICGVVVVVVNLRLFRLKADIHGGFPCPATISPRTNVG
jgi:hypothetical protein